MGVQMSDVREPMAIKLIQMLAQQQQTKKKGEKKEKRKKEEKKKKIEPQPGKHNKGNSNHAG